MKPIKVSPGRGGKSTIITVEASPEEAKLFLAALDAGALAKLGITGIVPEPDDEPTKTKWAQREQSRSPDGNKRGK